MINTDLSQQDLKSKMTDLQYQSARDYLINLVPYLSIGIFLIPISAVIPLLFSSDVISFYAYKCNKNLVVLY
ncbi:MAG: hypothetical protein LBU60_02080 [Clostridiales bacterium]|jgi:hypothetical protein|nr:hypothetical protein [Clostridiales bacterium]